MELDRALEGIKHEEAIEEIEGLLKKLKRGRISEQAFWESRSEELVFHNIEDPLLSPSDTPLDDMPLFLVHAWQQYAQEYHPRVKLHLMLEFVELSIRFSVAVLISQVRTEDVLPKDLSQQLSQLIRNPTLGQWLAILRIVSEYKTDSMPMPAMFQLYEGLDADTWLSSQGECSEEDSILLLRNHVAHGGGFSHEKASSWVAAHSQRVEDMLEKIMRALGDARFVSADKQLLLMGSKPSVIDRAELSSLPDNAVGCWIQIADAPIPLWPLADYSPVRQFDKNGQIKVLGEGETVQLYAALNKTNLHFTPLGQDTCLSQNKQTEQLRKLFALDIKKTVNHHHDVFQWDNFLDDAKGEAQQLVGRAQQMADLKAWMKARDTRQEGVSKALWLHGKAGMGKSMLVAKVVDDWEKAANAEKDNGLFYHRFRAGDARNSLRMFLKLLQQALWAWQPLRAQTTQPDTQLEDDKLLEDIQERLAYMEAMQSKHIKAAAPRYVLVVDGLDEVVSHEPKLIKSLQSLQLPGVIQLLSSRDEQGLGEAMQQLGAEVLYSGDGLAPLNASEIRSMLENELRSPSLLNALAAFDCTDTPDNKVPNNSYINKVLEASEGLPLYVHLLVDDLSLGKCGFNEDKLPESLRDYYDEIMNRIGISDVRRDLTEIIAMLAVSYEPLERDALSQLLANLLNGTDDWQDYIGRVDTAIEAGSSLLRISKSKDDGAAYTTYHHSYREYLLGDDSPIQGSVKDARKKLLVLAEKWEMLPNGNLKNHLFRQATAYALESGKNEQEQAACRLSCFAYLMQRLECLQASEMINLAYEYQQLADVLNKMFQKNIFFPIWSQFIQSKLHILACGDKFWSSEKILLQLGLNISDQFVMYAANKWCDDISSDRSMIKEVWPKDNRLSCIVRVLDAKSILSDIRVSKDESRFFSRSQDDEFIAWNSNTLQGEKIDWNDLKTVDIRPKKKSCSEAVSKVLSGFKQGLDEFSGVEVKTVSGAIKLNRDAILFWGKPCDELSIAKFIVYEWRIKRGKIASIIDDSYQITGVQVLSESVFVTFSFDGSIRLWDKTGGIYNSKVIYADENTYRIQGRLCGSFMLLYRNTSEFIQVLDLELAKALPEYDVAVRGMFAKEIIAIDESFSKAVVYNSFANGADRYFRFLDVARGIESNRQTVEESIDELAFVHDRLVVGSNHENIYWWKVDPSGKLIRIKGNLECLEEASNRRKFISTGVFYNSLVRNRQVQKKYLSLYDKDRSITAIVVLNKSKIVSIVAPISLLMPFSLNNHLGYWCYEGDEWKCTQDPFKAHNQAIIGSLVFDNDKMITWSENELCLWGIKNNALHEMDRRNFSGIIDVNVVDDKLYKIISLSSYWVISTHSDKLNIERSIANVEEDTAFMRENYPGIPSLRVSDFRNKHALWFMPESGGHIAWYGEKPILEKFSSEKGLVAIKDQGTYRFLEISGSGGNND